MEIITSRQNPLCTHLRKLAASASYRRQRGEFLCDSPKLLKEALLWGAELRTVVTTEGTELPELPEAAFPEQEWQQKGEPFPTQKLRLLCSPAFSDYGTGASRHPRLCKLPFFCTHDPTINCIIA